MTAKTSDTGVIVLLFLVILVAPTQYSFKLANAHLSIADPLIWLAALLYFLTILGQAFFTKKSDGPLEKRFSKTIKKLLPLPENIAFVVLIALSLGKAENIKESGKELLQVIEYILVAFVLFSKVKLDEKIKEKLKLLILILTAVVAGVALLQYFDDTTQIMGVKGTFSNRNTYGGFLAVTLPFILAIVLFGKKWSEKIWGSCILIVSSITLLSGAAALGLVFSLSLICVFASRRAFAFWLIILFIAAGFIIPKLPRENITVLKDSISIYDGNAQLEPRYTEWQASLQMWEEEPLLGVGVGNYQSQIGMNYGFLTVVEGPKEPDHNNLFLVFASSTGLLGFLGLATMLLLWFQRTTSKYFTKGTNEQKIWALGAMGGITAFCITSIWTALLIRGVFLILVIIVALALNSGSQPDTKGN